MFGHRPNQDLQRAAANTLSLADNAVMEIENASTRSGRPLPSDVQSEYDAALSLREQARRALERASSDAELTQASQDAAQSVLALQGVMRRIGAGGPMTNPLLSPVPGHRCFYCGRDDRPPYAGQDISDGRGNSMRVEVCSTCMALLRAGRTPQVTTAMYGGSPVPWWAVPNNPWYYGYGGPSWQYWLPFFTGMELGSWYGGGWGYGWGPDVMVVDDDAAGFGGDVSQDMGAADYGSYDAGSGGDSGGDWGGDSGGDGGWS